MIEQLEGERFVNIRTHRDTGETVATPVWFAALGDRFVFGTHSDSGKVRRIRTKPSVSFAAANYRGLERQEYESGTARILTGEEAAEAEAALADKYGWQWFPFSRLIDCFVEVVID